MPRDITDEGLEALDKADPQERRRFLSGLPSEDQQAIAAAVPKWREHKNAAALSAGKSAGFESPTMGMSVGAPAAVAPAAAPAAPAQPDRPAPLSAEAAAGVRMAFNASPSVKLEGQAAFTGALENAYSKALPQVANDFRAHASEGFWSNALVGLSPLTSIRLVDSAKALALDPLVSTIHQQYGAPWAEANIRMAKKLLPIGPRNKKDEDKASIIDDLLYQHVNKAKPFISPEQVGRAGEMLYRHFAAMGAGEGLAEQMPEKDRLEAQNDLEDIMRLPVGRWLSARAVPAHMVAEKIRSGLSSVGKAGIPIVSPVANVVSGLVPTVPVTAEEQAAGVASAAHGMGELPLYMLGGGWISDLNRAGGTAPRLLRAAASAVDAGLMGAAFTIPTPGAKPSEGFAGGVALGGLVEGGKLAGEGIGKAVPRIVAIGSRRWASEIAQHIGELAPVGKEPIRLAKEPIELPKGKAELAKEREGELAGFKAGVQRAVESGMAESAAKEPPINAITVADPASKEFAPLAGAVVVSKAPAAAPGSLVVRFASLKKGSFYIHEMPLGSIADAVKVRKFAAAKNDTPLIFSPEALQTFPGEFTRPLDQLSREEVSGAPDPDQLISKKPENPITALVDEQDGVRLSDLRSLRAKQQAMRHMQVLKTKEGKFAFDRWSFDRADPRPFDSPKTPGRKVPRPPPQQRMKVLVPITDLEGTELTTSQLFYAPSDTLKVATDAEIQTLARAVPKKVKKGKPLMPTPAAAASAQAPPAVRDVAPPEIGAPAVVGGGGGKDVGGSGGRPPDPPKPGDFSPAKANDYDTIYKLVKQGQRSPGMFERMKKFLLNGALYGPEDISQMIALHNGIKREGMLARDEVYSTIRSKFKNTEEFGKAFQDLRQVNRGKMTTDEFFAKHQLKSPAAAADAKLFIDNTLKEIQNTHRELQELNAVPDDLHPDDADRYSAEVYRARWMKDGMWGRSAPRGTLEPAIDLLAKENPKWTNTEIAFELNSIMKATDNFEAFKASPLGSKWANLLSRSQLPPEIKLALGAESSGAVTFAATVAAQRAILPTMRMWKMVAESPRFSATRMTGPEGDWLAVPNEPKLFGKAAGGYIHPQLEPIMAAPNFAEHSNVIARTLVGTVKQNLTVFGGLRPWLNNVMRNLKPAFLSGGIDMFAPRQSGATLMQAAKELAAWRASPVDPTGTNLILKIRRQGISLQGEQAALGLRDTDAMQKALDRALGNMKENSTLWDFLAAARKAVLNVATNKTRAHEVVKAGYDQIDPYFKVASVINIEKTLNARAETVRVGGSDAAGVNPFTQKPWLPEEAFREACQRVRLMFPDYANVSPAIDKLTKTSVGQLSLFFRGAAEDWRVNLHGIPSLLKRDPLAKWRAVGGTAALTTLATALVALRRANGISDKEVELAASTQPRRSLIYRHGAFILPYRNELGQLQPFDTSAWSPELQMLQGDEEDGVAANVSYQLVNQFLAQGAAEPGLRKLATMSGWLSPQGQGPPPLAGDHGALKAIWALNDMGLLGPRAVSGARNDLQQAGVAGDQARSLGTEPMAMSTLAGRQAGLPLMRGVTPPVASDAKAAAPANDYSPTALAKAEEFQGDAVALQKNIRRIIMMTRPEPGDSKAREADKEALKRRLIDAELAQFRGRADKMQSLGDMATQVDKERGK
jgi:hypothetical protein